MTVAGATGRRLLPRLRAIERQTKPDDPALRAALDARRRELPALREGVVAQDPAIRAAQERLQACAYGMAHPELDEVVLACVQHSALDAHGNVALIRLLPRPVPTRSPR